MFKYYFFLIFYNLLIIISDNPLNILQNTKNDIFSFDTYNFYRTAISYFINEDNSFLNNLNISDQCYTQLENSFFKYEMSISISSYPYYKKLIFDSSHFKNDLSSYKNCINKKVDTYNNDHENFTFFTIFIDDKKSLYDILTTNCGTSPYLFGLCFIDNCTMSDYEVIIRKGLTLFNLTEKKDATLDFLPEIQIYKFSDNIKSEGFIKFLQLLPFIIICIHLIFVIFNSIPLYIYKIILFIFFCKKYQKPPSSTRQSKLSKILLNIRDNKNKKNKNYKINYKEEKDKERNPSNLSRSSYMSLEDNVTKTFDILYDITNNFTSLIELKKQNEITNDGGLAYINGIKGLSMIFFLFGSVYSALYGSIITYQTSEDFYYHLENVFFSIFYIGIKYAPKLLLCTSGFSLFFKFICYLDGKIENEIEIKRQKDESSINATEIKEINNHSNKKMKNEDKEKSDDNYNISRKYLYNFFLLQLHKYILYILVLFFIIYSLDWIVNLFGTPGLIWDFFNQSSINPAREFNYIIPLLIGFKSFFIPGLSPNERNILNYLYLVFQEIIYFLITTVIIFIGYKKNLRIDRFLKIVFLILIVLRIVYYFIDVGLDDKDYFGFHKYGQFYTSMIYNYTFYIIGVHFGMINYVIQKGYSFTDCQNNNKIYLNSSFAILNIIKKKNKKNIFIITIISGIFTLINIFIQNIIIYFIKLFKSNNLQLNMEKYKRDFFSQMIMLFDSDIFVLSVNGLALCMYLKGDNNIINNILCHSLWSIFNRFYFSYILLINPIILYLFYNLETKILFNISNCFLYTFICGIFVYFISMIIYITFELPFKKIIRFWFNLNEHILNKERLNNIETTYSFKENEHFMNSVTVDISECNDDDDDDD